MQREQMTLKRAMRTAAAAAVALAVTAGHTFAAPACTNTGNFERWLETFKQEAATTHGIPKNVIDSSLRGVTFDPAVIQRDRAQGVFTQSFLQFSDRMAGGGRYQNGLRMLKTHAALLAQIEEKIGVPPPVVVGLWGLESDYGAYKGTPFNVIRSVATLAFDCRRSALFRQHLIDALKLVARGDLKAEEMIGNWAGELGPTQFVPSEYWKHGVDFDGDGRVDMLRSTPDALASAANLMRAHGWQKGQPWLQEVRVPNEMPWEQAGVDIQHPRSQWVRWGVRGAHRDLPSDNMPASLILPMGRLGPAFLAYNNFKAFLEWNSALVYTTTAGYFTTRLAGAPPVGRGNGTPFVPTAQQVQEIQRLLIAQKLLVGDADGRMGSMTRAAIKKAQQKLGMPADSYPTADLADRLRAGR
jgi:lytic murein transglycosylase